LYGWGAAIVIVGALFKIQHWPAAGFFLVLGLSTEAVIFFFSAFEPPHEDVDWSLVYPELAGMHEDDSHGKKEKKKKVDPVSQKLDALLSEAKIGPELLESLGTGMKALGENAKNMADVSQAAAATDGYAKNISEASNSVNALSSSFKKAAEATSGFSAGADDVKDYNNQVVNASKNLSALNAVYEMQLQDSNSHLKATSKFYEGIQELMGNLNASLEDTKKYKDEVSSLAKNLGQLNTIYGNMLNAMQGNKS
jgi:gliding motility-associated protein GldL